MSLATKKSIKWPNSVTELHVHVGGSVPLYRLWEIAVERGIRGLGKGYDDFLSRVRIDGSKVHDLDSYLEVYDTIELIQSGPDAIRQSIIIAIHRAYRTGGMAHLGPGGEGGDPDPLFSIGRLELRLNPLKRTGAVFHKGKHAGLYDVDRIIKSCCDAVEDVALAFRGKIEVGLIFCFGRDMTYEANMILAEKTAQWKEVYPCIVGLDLAGSEAVNPLNDAKKLEEMSQVYKEAGKGLGHTVHVGETTHIDIDTFIKTIEAINPQRVAHPIVAYRAYIENKDDRGFKLLKERNIVCELCVKSNLLTRALPSLEEYGKFINILDKYEIPYTFNTDAPSLQVSSLAQEILMLLEHGLINEEQILRSFKAADEFSFLNINRF